MSTPSRHRGGHTRERLASLGTIRRMVWEADRRRATLGAVLLFSTGVMGGFASLSLKWILDGLIEQRWSFAIGAALLAAAMQGLISVAGRVSFNCENVLAALVGIRLNREILATTSALPGLEHFERPEILDRVELVRDRGQQLAATLWIIGNGLALVVRIVMTLVLLAGVHPVLLLLPLFAVPSVFLAAPAHRIRERASEATAEKLRKAGRLHEMFVDPATAKELRVFECADALNERCDEWWLDGQRRQMRAQLVATLIGVAGWASFALGFVGALYVAVRVAVRGGGTAGDVLLVWQLALQARAHVGWAEGTIRGVSGAFATLDRLSWLTEYAAEQRALHADAVEPPSTIERGIVFDDVSFAYPGTEEEVLSHVSFEVPVGTTVAIVGENGAGKTTLAKLLAAFYRPTSGRILLDGVDVATMDAATWQSRLSAVFQDFAKLEVRVRETVGAGDLARADDPAPIATALEAADATGFVRDLPEQEETLLGKTYHAGQELSGGQWQKLAVARGLLRHEPLLLLLDEPTAALDPASEHVLFERYADAATWARHAAGVTVLISHRFSTVRMADQILVLDGGRLVQSGRHADLMAAGGLYAEMFEMQAQAYR